MIDSDCLLPYRSSCSSTRRLVLPCQYRWALLSLIVPFHLISRTKFVALFALQVLVTTSFKTRFWYLSKVSVPEFVHQCLKPAKSHLVIYTVGSVCSTWLHSRCIIFLTSRYFCTENFRQLQKLMYCVLEQLSDFYVFVLTWSRAPCRAELSKHLEHGSSVRWSSEQAAMWKALLYQGMAPLVFSSAMCMHSDSLA